MERAEQGEMRGDSSSSRVLSTSASFRSAVSYASFRSCNSFKSTDGFSRASFKSAASRGTSYHSAASKRFLGRSVSDTGPGSEALEGVDNLSFFSFEGGEETLPSLQTEGPKLAASRRPSIVATPADLGLGKEAQISVSRPGHCLYLGCLLLLLTACLHTATAAIPSLLSPGLDPWAILLSRALLQLGGSLLFLPLIRVNPLGPPGYRWRLYLLSLLSAALVLSLHVALTRLPRAEVGALLGLAPILTVVLAVPLAKEHFGLLRLLTCILLVAGILLQTRPTLLFPGLQGDRLALTQYNILGIPVTFPPPLPPLTPTDSMGSVAAITAALLSAMLLLVSSQCRVKGAIHTVLILQWTSLGLTLVSVIGLCTQTVDPVTVLQLIPQNDWLVAVLVSVLGCLATACLAISLSWVTPGRAGLLVSASLLLSYAVQLVLDPGEGLPSWPDLVGAVCLLLSLLCIGLEGVMVDAKRWRWL